MGTIMSLNCFRRGIQQPRSIHEVDRTSGGKVVKEAAVELLSTSCIGLVHK